MRELIPGIEFDFGGGVKKIIPPLSLGALQRLQGKLEALTSATSPLEASAVATVVEATHSALKRNYPDVRIDEVADLIDVSNMHDVIGCVLDVAGLRRKAQAEEAKKLPAQSVHETQVPIGPASSPESAVTPAGPGPTSGSTLTYP